MFNLFNKKKFTAQDANKLAEESMPSIEKQFKKACEQEYKYCLESIKFAAKNGYCEARHLFSSRFNSRLDEAIEYVKERLEEDGFAVETKSPDCKGHDMVIFWGCEE